MSKQMTVKDLLKQCKWFADNGYGDRLIVLSDDYEGNGYHGLFEDLGLGLVSKEEFKKYHYEDIINDSYSNKYDEIIFLG